ncbi:hypothetical protein Acr_26g0002510 [Actinidia rufa]|uniref:Uncharacterized protein n=1 Tax=Actinidia rufa TaxID=165716 RepID=A0A7J0H1W0_9ERIC|nr:hypothetical protein Acr_26g0002510 [Actinidia rufa]
MQRRSVTRFKAPHPWSIGSQGREPHRISSETKGPSVFARRRRRRQRQITEAPQIDTETREIHSPHSDSHRPLLPRLLPLLSRSVSNRFGSVRRISPIVEAYRFN